MLILALNALRDSQAINQIKSYTFVGSSYLTYSYFFPLYKETTGDSGFSKQQYVSRSVLFGPAPWSGMGTAMFAEGVYSCHLPDAERVLPVARSIFLWDGTYSMARQGCWHNLWNLVLPQPGMMMPSGPGGPT